jgi:hypothetical protein
LVIDRVCARLNHFTRKEVDFHLASDVFDTRTIKQQEKRRGESMNSIKQRNRKIDITENEGRKRNWTEDNFLTFIQKRKSI